jgi:hypothetical protein
LLVEKRRREVGKESDVWRGRNRHEERASHIFFAMDFRIAIYAQRTPGTRKRERVLGRIKRREQCRGSYRGARVAAST